MHPVKSGLAIFVKLAQAHVLYERSPIFPKGRQLDFDVVGQGGLMRNEDRIERLNQRIFIKKIFFADEMDFHIRLATQYFISGKQCIVMNISTRASFSMPDMKI